jgi:hypothetical protein
MAMANVSRISILRQLKKIFIAANAHCDEYVEPPTLATWRVRVTAMPLATPEFCAEAPLFIPLPASQLAGP